MIILLNTPKFYKLEKRELTNSELCTVSIDVEYKEAQHIEKKEEIDLRSFEGYEMVKSSGFLEIVTSKLTARIPAKVKKIQIEENKMKLTIESIPFSYEKMREIGITAKEKENFEMSWNIYLYFIRKEQILVSKKFTIFKATVKQPLKIITSVLQQD
ncbi:MAG: hypothetical protein ACTSVW_01100 [Candidatus Njordarchaeales archaeon]